jgi:pimeloyl-ACP methyl ester carboxylesterase
MNSIVVLLAAVSTLSTSLAPPASRHSPTGRVTAAGASQRVVDVAREQVDGDIYHYRFIVKVGDTANAVLAVHRIVRERAPWSPRPTHAGAMLLHGDFATFTSSFVPGLISAASPRRHGLAVFLAEQGIDVWGMDRRWAQAPAVGADLSDFAGMGLAAEVEDVGLALQFARALRAISTGHLERVFLAGFSRGALLTYLYAGEDALRPATQRQLRGIVPIDVYARLAPEDEPLRQAACIRLDQELAAIAAGQFDTDNTAFSAIGPMAGTDPSGPSPFFAGFTNEQAMLLLVGQTYMFFTPTPSYHLNGASFDASGMPTGLAYSAERLVDDWLAAAPPHQASREIADSDAFWCNQAPLPVADHLAEIRVPVLYLGAAGGFGEYGAYTTKVLASTDVTRRLVRRLDVGSEAFDFGHADLLFAADAPTLAWEPVADWMLSR